MDQSYPTEALPIAMNCEYWQFDFLIVKNKINFVQCSILLANYVNYFLTIILYVMPQFLTSCQNNFITN